VTRPALLSLLLVAVTTSAFAEEPVAPYSDNYTGAFVAAGAAGGMAHVTVDGQRAWGPAFSAWLQWSAPLQVIDLQASWVHADVDDLTYDTFVAAVGIHPLFILHLESSPLFYVLGGAYLLVGVDVDLVRGARRAQDPGVHLGAGIDVPLDNVDDGGAFWLGIQYRRNTVDIPREASPISVVQDVFLLRIAWRNNGLLFAVP
jgi:hypothetical protein